MILQTLLALACLTVVAGALLTGALVEAKIATHQAAARLAASALSRGTDEFVNWAQIYVAQHGAAATWPTTPIVDQPVPACGGGAQGTCTTFLTIGYQIAAQSSISTSGPDPIANLQIGLNEGRIAGSITATITNESGTVLSSASQLVTIRIFDAPPFAAVTGDRITASIAGPQNVSEGDTGGYRNAGVVDSKPTPDIANPALDQVTVISLTMSCANTLQNSNQSNPFSNNHTPGNDSLPWGTSGGTAFEAPCTPSYSFSLTPAIPTDALLPTGNVYDVSSVSNATWSANINKAGWAP